MADEVESFLLQQQCSDGSFRAELTADKAATEQGCAVGATGEIDTTALTVVNILDTPEASPAARAAALAAANWLRTQQAADGSFSAGALGANSNTTGLAGWALAGAGLDAEATRAASWLRGLQLADLAPCATALTADNGGILYKPVDLATVRSAGTLSVPVRELTRRATAQALPALALVPAGGAVTISAPATAVEQSTVTVTVAGLGAGEPACVSFAGQSRSVTGTGSPVALTFTLPAGAASRTFTVATLGGTSVVTTAATAAPLPPAAADLQASRVEKVRKGRFTLDLACAADAPCIGKITVRTARKVAVEGLKKRKTVRISERRYRVAAGDEGRVRMRLTRTARDLVADGKVKVKAVVGVRGGERTVTTFWLKAAKG